MKVYYDHQVDALYLQLGMERPEGVTELTEEVHLDLTEDGGLVGIEILSASKKMDLQTLLSYTLELDKQVIGL